VETSKDFEELFELLNHHKVRYLVVGGYAFAIHAEPRYTKDLDIFYHSSESNSKKLLHCIKDFGFESLQITVEDLIKPGRVIQIGHSPLRVDFLNMLDGVSFEECWINRINSTYGNQTIQVIGRKELINNKMASGREQDLLDVKVLEKFE